MSLSFHLLVSSGKTNHLIPALVCSVNGIHIIRTLDPELPHQVSVARIFTCAGLSITDGLLKNKLERGIDYFVDLGVSGPKLLEIWTSVSKARTIIASLWPKMPPPELIDLTARSLDRCWTLYDITRSSLLHNWRIGIITTAAYSTALLLQSVFDIKDIVQNSDKTTWLRTGLPARGEDQEEDQDLLDVITLKWSVNAVERYLSKSRDVEDDTQVNPDWQEPVALMHEFLRVPQRVSDEDAVEIFEVTMADSCERILRQLKSTSRPIARRRKSVKIVKPQLISVATQTDDTIEVRPIEYSGMAAEQFVIGMPERAQQELDNTSTIDSSMHTLFIEHKTPQQQHEQAKKISSETSIPLTSINPAISLLLVVLLAFLTKIILSFT